MGNITALAHHWLVGMRGGEKVLEQFSLLFPEAPIYTLVADRSQLSAQLLGHSFSTSLIQRLPGGIRYYHRMLPLFPLAVGNLRVDPSADFLLSSDAAVIKGLRKPAKMPHVCFCHSPPRYLWDLHDTYLSQTSDIGALGRAAFRIASPYVREFDRLAARQVDHFIANSNFVRDRIERYYGRSSTVIYPPVAVEDFALQADHDGYYLIVSQLVPYKRIDLAVEAFNQLNKRLIIIGTGSEMGRLKAMAKSNVEILGSQPFPVIKQHYERCRAFIFPGIEDFGITPLEAQACGKCVIGLGKGGLLETAIDGETALFFHKQTTESLVAAVEEFEGARQPVQPEACRRNALRFGQARFRKQIAAFLAERLPELFKDYPWPESTVSL